MRTLRIDGDLTEEFVLEVVPKTLAQTMNKFLSEAPNKEQMQEFLDEQKFPSIKTIITEAEKTLLITSQGGEFILITFDQNVKIEGYPIMPLLKLLEYGNTEVKGLHFINKAFDYVEQNLNHLYHLYELSSKGAELWQSDSTMKQ